MSDPMTLEFFTENLGRKFSLDTGKAGTLELEVTEAEAVGSPKNPEDGVRAQAFSVVFRGPSDPVLEQQICKLTSPDGAEVELFLVPIGPAQDGMQYEAVFT